MNRTNILAALLLAMLAVLFSLANKQPVYIHFFSFSSGMIPLYIAVFIAFLFGFLGGIIALSFSRYKHKREIQRLQGENQRLAEELDNLRNIPLQDDL
ncbi:MAG: LapA family protein [Mariprofundaceae bacterium]|nr:LapA family protein [Mariprofundaceae bacterium]